MILFVIYTAAVWLVCFAHRRRPVGLILAPVAALPLVSVGLWLNRQHDTTTIWALGVFAFAGLVGLIAVFLAVQPRRPPSACDACGYDLAGITAPVCPECGEGATSPSLQDLPANALSPDQAAALRARRARTRWSAPVSATTSATPATPAITGGPQSERA